MIIFLLSLGFLSVAIEVCKNEPGCFKNGGLKVYNCLFTNSCPHISKLMEVDKVEIF